jgi:hypothetical protein
MNAFLGLLAAVVGLMTVITLSIMELWVTPWPILLILLLVILWTSQRLIDRFNPAPVEGLGSLPNPLEPSNPLGVPKEVTSDHPDSALRYRGQVYEEAQPTDPLLEEIVQEAKPTCYRGIRLETPDRASSPEPPAKPQPPDPPQPQLSYRGIKRS